MEPIILIIDDDPNDLAVMTSFLEDRAFTILVAEDSKTGLKRAHKAKPDIILLDVLMPQMDGYETCRRLKSMESTRDIPVIFMTALVETEHKLKGFAAGAVDYITKPFQIEEVLGRVGVHLCMGELTARLREEKELLEQRVEERTAELARANKDLQAEMTKYRTLVEHSLQGLTITQDCRFVYVNRAFSEMIGYTVEELLSMAPDEFRALVHPADQALVRDRMRDCMAAKSAVPQYEIRMIKKDGDIRWLQIYNSFVDYKGKKSVQTALIDITERKRAEEVLKRNFERSVVLLKLSQMIGATLQENMKFALEEMVRLTGSKTGYLGLMNKEETAMSINVQSCSIMAESDAGDGTLPFTSETADLWKDVVSQRRPVVVNDCKAANNWKKGHPEGHDEIVRHMNIPIFVDQSIVLVAGVANKEEEYDESDVQQFTMLVEGIWRLIDRRRSEEELRESQRMLLDIINFLPDATLVIDDEGKVIAWNKAIEDMTGVKAAEMLGKGNYEYSVPFYGERRPILIDIALQPQKEVLGRYRNIKWQGDVLIGESYIQNLKEGMVYLFGTASPLYDTKGAIVGAIETIRDITDRKRMEVELACEHDRLASILDGIPTPAFMIDQNQTVVLWNRNSEIFLEKTKEEVLGKKLDLSFLFESKNQPSLAELVLEMTDKEIIQKYSSKGIHKSDIFPGAFEGIRTIFPGGGKRVISTQAARIYNQQRQVIGAVQTAQDITESIQIQEDREKLQSQVIQTQKMEAIGNLAGGIAHDFNNILTGIMGYSELCRIQVQGHPKACRHIEQILKATDRAKDLVQQILTFSRKTELEKKPLVLSPVVKEVAKFMRASLPTTIEIVQTIDAASDAIMADPTQMHQVLMNLCTNAGHAMKESGGVLEIGLRKIFISTEDLLHHPSLRYGHHLELIVRDTGQGISPENKARIFEPYFTTKVKGEGTGLGLAVVHGIVKEHGGEISVYSEEGKGCIFRVYLPLIEKKLETEKDTEEAPLPGKGEKILFVDDEKVVVDLSKQLLEGLGYRVMAETDPVRALAVYKEDPDNFDLLITDKYMPQLTGFDLAREIRTISTGIPVILCTGSQEKEDAGRIAADKINQLIIKPARISSLARAIRDVLDEQVSDSRYT